MEKYLYAARKDVCDSRLDVLAIRKRPNELWIYRKPDARLE